MRVGIDATGWTNRRGHGRFTRGAFGRLIALDPEIRYVLYADRATAGEIDVPEGAELRIVPLSRATAEAAAAGSNRSPSDLLRLGRAVATDRPAAFVFPSIYTWFPCPVVRTAVGVHDLTARLMPDLTLPDRRARALWRLKESWAIRSATVVFSVSKASRAAIARDFRVTPESIPIVFEAPDPLFFPRSVAPGFGLRRGEYLLFVGGISPHKNLPALLRAYAQLLAQPREANTSPPPLVIAGELERDPYLSATGATVALIEALGLHDRVVLTGFVSDEELARLYSGATATVLPSLAEGFDLPAVEAAACGSPILLSDLPAHRETLGDAGLLFSAHDVHGITACLQRVIADAELRGALSTRARAAVAPLSWDAAAHALKAIVMRTIDAGADGRLRRVRGRLSRGRGRR